MRQFDLPKIRRSRKSLLKWTTALVAGSIAAAIVVAITEPPGPGLDPDAASYLGAAQSLAQGRGYRIPISDWLTPDSTSALSHFPPGYPTAIALPIAFGFSPMNSARLVNAVAAFADVVLLTWLVATAVGLISAIALVLVLLAMPAFVEVHLSILSEPLFLACVTGTLAAMVGVSRRVDERSRLWRALIAGCAGAAAMLVRYAGAAMIVAVVLWVTAQPGSVRERTRRGLLAALPPLLLVGAWFVHVRQTSTGHAVRTLGAYGGVGETLRMGAATVVAWLVPLMSDQTLPGRGWIALAILVGTIALVRLGIGAARHRDGAAVIAAAATLAACYVVVLLASRLLADPDIPFDNRLLVPLFVLVAIIAGAAIRAWWQTARGWTRVICAAALLLWLGASLMVSADEVSWALENGEDFAQRQWTESPLLEWARANASQRTLYSNWPAAVVFHLHRASHELPREGDANLLRAFA
ncbi:MAG TPA: glycosyltransferase family 39 protein, partial [Gemmatimonadaceae bacterium]|nr:glycosyltransferase family 39 protein [Gemmatimonadaceae bacterium]